MEKELSIYVSASPEMDPECELLGQRLAALPKSIRWLIKRTPGRHEYGNPDLVALQRSQFYLLLMGTDIVAPVGVEWLAAQKAGLACFAYRNASAITTPAASFFIHNTGLNWEAYKTPQEFIRHFERALIEQLIKGTPGYGLEVADLEHLSAQLKALEEDAPGPSSEERRGAGRGGVILPAR
jgi:hypothetical protein